VNFDAVPKTAVGVQLQRNVPACGTVNSYSITQGFAAAHLQGEDVTTLTIQSKNTVSYCKWLKLHHRRCE